MDIYDYIEERGNEITQKFGMSDFAKKHPEYYGPNGHPGIDYVPDMGNEVRALFGGKVVKAHYNPENENSPNGYADNPYGNYVIVKNEDKKLFYAHLKQIRVQKDDELLEGDHIGIMGMTGKVTGSHVHFEVRNNDGKNLDPEVWFIHEGSKEQTNNENMSNEELIKHVYKGILGRNPDKKGKEYYLEKMKNGEMDLDDVIRAVSRSEEFVNDHVKIVID